MPEKRETKWNINPGVKSRILVKPSLCAATAAMMVAAQMTPKVISSPPVTFNTFFISFSNPYLTAIRNIHSASVAKLPWIRYPVKAFLLQALSFLRNTPAMTITIQTNCSIPKTIAPVHHHIFISSLIVFVLFYK